MNPYELRMKVLQLAFETLNMKYQAEMDRWRMTENCSLALPATPTAAEIIAEADKFNKFIS